jgi:hypothetical protein
MILEGNHMKLKGRFAAMVRRMHPSETWWGNGFGGLSGSFTGPDSSFVSITPDPFVDSLSNAFHYFFGFPVGCVNPDFRDTRGSSPFTYFILEPLEYSETCILHIVAKMIVEINDLSLSLEDMGDYLIGMSHLDPARRWVAMGVEVYFHFVFPPVDFVRRFDSAYCRFGGP